MGFSHGANRHEAILGPERLDASMAAEHPVRVLEAFVDHRTLPTLGLQRAPRCHGPVGLCPGCSVATVH